jgi:hypothetical protein
MSRIVDITGQKFGRLTAIRFVEINSHRDAEWMFQCECGKECVTVADRVKRGQTRSCGCLKIEIAVSANTKHGCHGTRLYGIWSGMRRRCSNPNRKDWANYGGRGITVCDEWRNDFLLFYEWAMSNGYNDSLSIDRKNNSKGYCPENCKWTNKQQQNNNTRANRQITAFGETKNLQQWSDESGIGHSTILFRLKSGWTPEDAVSIAPKIGANQYDAASRLSNKTG